MFECMELYVYVCMYVCMFVYLCLSVYTLLLVIIKHAPSPENDTTYYYVTIYW